MGVEENRIAKQIIDYCRTRHWPITRHQSGTMQGGRMKLGAPGWPDYILVVKGIGTVLLETKAEGKELSDPQAERIAELRKAGAVVIVADSLGQFIFHVKGLTESNQGWRMKY